MSRERPSGRAPSADVIEGVLRLPDGSRDIAAYAKLAHRERAAAIASSARATLRRLHGVLSATGARLAAVVRSQPVAGKRHAHNAR